MSEQRYYLMALVYKYDGHQYTQCITYLNDATKNDKAFIDKCIRNFVKMLGKDYYLANTWVE